MDAIEKILRKLNDRERRWVREILKKLQARRFDGLDVKKLKGRGDIFRARKGDVRIIYRASGEKEIFILAIERRSEKTYTSKF